ncbi:hypothetical protein [Sorangium sp. So ce1024]
MSQINANRSPGAEDLAREAPGEGVAPRGGDRAAAGGRHARRQGRGS